MRASTLASCAAIAAALVAACYVGPASDDPRPVTESAPADPSAGETDEGDGASPSGADRGLPCEIDALLESRCRSCHGGDPSRSPMPLVTYEDLAAPAKSDARESVADVSLERMRSRSDPMPPGRAPKATTAELAAFSEWVADGMPRATCAPKPARDAGTKPAAPDAGEPASVCTSGTTWTGAEASSRMNPGRACIACHAAAAGRPILQIGGTVYPSLHEPDRCYGAEGAFVVVTDATGRAVTLPTGSTGNFTLSASVAALVHPIKVKVVRNGIERAMQGSPPHGDCNGCHTETGKNGAPGRILLP